jgi:DNA-binding NarL/FixJ family response regulator
MIYFIQSQESFEDGPIKIGYTDDPDLRSRLRDLQVGNPYELKVLGVIAEGDYTLEKELHDRFSDTRLQGEWFKCSISLQGFIKRNSRGYYWGKSDHNNWDSKTVKKAKARHEQVLPQIVKMRKEGMTLKCIAESVNYSEATICTLLQQCRRDGLIV